MSRTDKDVPYRVHLARSGKERHDHRFGPCDLDEWTPDRYWVIRQRGTSCRRVEGNNYFRDSLPLFSRSKLIAFFAGNYYNAEKSRVQARTRDIAKMHRAGEEIEWEDVPARQHRHSAEWEAW